MSAPVCPECKAGKHRICVGVALDLNTDEFEPCGCSVCSELCTAEVWSWDVFKPEVVDPYWMHCNRVGVHDEHENSDTGATWRTDQSVGGDE